MWKSLERGWSRPSAQNAKNLGWHEAANRSFRDVPPAASGQRNALFMAFWEEYDIYRDTIFLR
jgi:hypothetical protein